MDETRDKFVKVLFLLFLSLFSSAARDHAVEPGSTKRVYAIKLLTRYLLTLFLLFVGSSFFGSILIVPRPTEIG